MTSNQPTETSPLLAPEAPRHTPDLPPIDPTVAVASRETDIAASYGSIEPSPSTTVVETPVSGASENGHKLDDEERQDGIPAASGPERQRMRYIFPAVALGVFMAAADQTIIVSSYGKIGTDLNALSSTSWIATS